MADDDSSFFSRWSRRKVQSRGEAARETALEPAPEPAAVPERPPTREAMPARSDPATAAGAATPTAEAALPPPTLEDTEQLTHDSDYTRFVRRDVEPEVQRAALKKLFSDPHFNVMDGLDVYIDDYNKPDPLPPDMLRKMAQSRLLGLFEDEAGATTLTPALSRTRGQSLRPCVREREEDAAAAAVGAATAAARTDDEDTDLQLQPDDGAGRADAGENAGTDPGRQH